MESTSSPSSESLPDQSLWSPSDEEAIATENSLDHLSLDAFYGSFDETQLFPAGEKTTTGTTPNDFSTHKSQPPVDMKQLSVYCSEKAGMRSVDANYVNAVVYEMSKDSSYFQNAQAKAKKTKERITKLQQELQNLKKRCMDFPAYRELLKSNASKRLQQIEKNRDFSRIWMHIDMDMFYAAVEMRDRPELKGKPIAVGGMSMLCTSNYEARLHGVRSAMPGFIALKLCPDLILIHPNFQKYKAVADDVHAILAEYDPHFESTSLDEAYLDLTDYIVQKLKGDDQTDAHNKFDAVDSGHSSKCPSMCQFSKLPPMELAAEIVQEIRHRIVDKTKCTASAGIACNKMLAKLCTDVKKPNGQYYLPSTYDSVLDFLKDMPVRKVPGIGKVMERILNELGIQKCSHVMEIERVTFILPLFSQTTSTWLLSACSGIARNKHESAGTKSDEHRVKQNSISCERTFRELHKVDDLVNKCKEIAMKLAKDVVEAGVRGRTVTLKLKTVKFDVKQRSITLDSAVYTGEDLFKHAVQLLYDELNELAAVKRMGSEHVVSTGLHPSPFSENVASSFPLRPLAQSNPKEMLSNLLHLRLMGIRLSSLSDLSIPNAPDANADGHQNASSSKNSKLYQYFSKMASTANQNSFIDSTENQHADSNLRGRIFDEYPDGNSEDVSISYSAYEAFSENEIQPQFQNHLSSTRKRKRDPNLTETLDLYFRDGIDDSGTFAAATGSSGIASESPNNTNITHHNPPLVSALSTASSSQSGKNLLSNLSKSIIPNTPSNPNSNSHNSNNIVMHCPICSAPFSSSSPNYEINEHIDICLNIGSNKKVGTPTNDKLKKKGIVKGNGNLPTSILKYINRT